MHGSFYTQTFLHTEAFTHRHFYTQKLLHTEAFTHRRFYTQTLLHTGTFTHKHVYAQRPDPWNRNFTSVLGDQISFRAKMFAGQLANRNFTSVFGDQTSFRAKGLRRTREIGILAQLLAIKPHFVQKGCAGQEKSQFYLSFCRTSFRAKGLRLDTRNRNFTSVLGGRTSFRAKGLRFAPSRWHCPAPSREK